MTYDNNNDNNNIINKLLEEKKRILQRRRETPKNDIETRKEINNDYMKIYMKIQYHTDENKRINKCFSSNIYNKNNYTDYKNYQRIYQRQYQARKNNNIILVS